MLRFSPWFAVALILLAPPVRSRATPEDEKLLRAAGVAVDGPGLLSYLREQSLSGVEQCRAAVLIARLGRDSFRERQAASARLRTLRPRILPLLRRGLNHPDEEIQDRLRDLIAEAGDDPGPARRAAAVRLAREKAPAGAVAVLLDFLPCVDDEALENETLFTLALLGAHRGKVDPALAAAVEDALPSRRAAAGLVLGRSGTAEQRAAARALLADADPTVRFRAAQGLLAGRDRAALPTLVALLSEGSPGVAKQAEELLFAVAGARAPRYGVEEDPFTRRITKAAWTAWWKANSRIDLARADVELPPWNPALRLRDAARRFCIALTSFDGEAVRKVSAVPFLWMQQPLASGDDLENLVNQGALGFRVAPGALPPLTPIPLDEHLRIAPPETRTQLAPHKNEVRVFRMSLANGPLVVDPSAPRRNNEFFLYLRVVNGQPRVIGVASGGGPAIIY
jgi:hypothetical protein